MIRRLSLAGVSVGAAGVAASLAALYLGMRELMVSHGGSCVSGGPYVVAPGHTCDGAAAWLLGAAPFAGLALTALLVAASDEWSDDRIAGVGSFVWGAMFASLGWNFIDLGIDPPAGMSGAGVWILCGGLFWALAVGGFAYAAYAMRDYFRGADAPSPWAAPPPLVRATVTVAAQQAAQQHAVGVLGGTPAAARDDRPGSPWVWLGTVLVSAAVGATAGAAAVGLLG